MNQPDRESDPVWLSYIRECIAEVDEYTGNKRERFDESRMVRRAVERVLQTLAESTRRLSEGIKATEPGITLGGDQRIPQTRWCTATGISTKKSCGTSSKRTCRNSHQQSNA